MMQRLLRTALIVIGVLSGIHATALAQGEDIWTQVSDHGFGDGNNHGVVFLLEYEGYLWAGTTNSSTGCELWRTLDGSVWVWTNRGGFGDSNNWMATTGAIFNGDLYIGTSNAVTGCEVWRKVDGTSSMSQVNQDGFGAVLNKEVTSMRVYEDYLYVAVSNRDGAQMWRTVDGTTWLQVESGGFGNGHNNDIYAMEEFRGQLVVGTTNWVEGAEIWQTYNGTSWVSVSVGGFGDTTNGMISAMVADQSQGALFAGTNTGSETTAGADVWRTANATWWQPVTSDGFGSINNLDVASAYWYGGAAWFATFNTQEGTEMWRTQPDFTSEQVSLSGFGSGFNLGAFAMTEYRGALYVGTYNGGYGAEVWRTSTVFVDGFESGDLSAWSTVSPSQELAIQDPGGIFRELPLTPLHKDS